MANVLLAMIAFVAVSVAGWLIAEAKGKACVYESSEEEQQALESFNELHLKDDGREMGISDVIKTISTTGF